MLSDLLISASLAGFAVVAITVIAGRVGGTIGGLLATAPVTSAAALVFLSMEGGNAAIGTQVLAGGQSLFAALIGMPVFFYGLKHTSGANLYLRLSVSLAAYIAVFTSTTLIVFRLTPAAWAPVWLAACLVTAAIFGATFLKARLPPMQKRAPKMALNAKEVILRFVAGASVIVLVGILRGAVPALSTAWAVFPGTFLVSLWVLGTERGAAFSARACQGAVMGIPPLVAYLMVLWAVLPLYEGMAWAWLAQVPAWVAYFAVLVPLTKARVAQPRGVAA